MSVNFSQAPSLKLGCYDAGLKMDEKAKRAYLGKYHQAMSQTLQNNLKFKGEHQGVWRPFVAIDGHYVRDLQTFLKGAGFMPNHEPDGIFGYETASGVRLFQEYMRTFKDKTTMKPDGIVGQGTYGAIEEWQNNDYGTCEWADGTASTEHTKWIALLAKRKAHLIQNPSAVVRCRENFKNSTDTKVVAEWDVSSDRVHLIGIRRNQKKTYTENEKDHDLFVLLINGMVFKFFGSTVPNPNFVKVYTTYKGKSVKNLPFLLESQHSYKLGWHKINDRDNIYEAWRPANHGVLVYRKPQPFKQANIIDDFQLMNKSLDKHGNRSINIHWSGRGTTNFSAGCQVIGGRSYFNNKGELIDDIEFVAINKKDLNLKNSKHLKAAYNMLLDLFTNYTKGEERTIAYSVVREETLYELGDWTRQEITDLVTKMNKYLPKGEV